METTLTIVISEIFLAANSGSVSSLALFDFRTVFDTVDHQILLIWLQTSHHITGSALNWLKSYLEGRSQSVNYGTLTYQSITYQSITCPSNPGVCTRLFAIYLYTSDVFKLSSVVVAAAAAVTVVVVVAAVCCCCCSCCSCCCCCCYYYYYYCY